MLQQENISEDLIQEVLEHYPFYSLVEIYLGRDTQSIEDIEILSRSSDRETKIELAKAIVEGRCKTFNKEIIGRLANDKDITDDVRLSIQERPEYEEVIPEEYDTNFKYRTSDHSYGGDGPGSFDNMGGERRYFINGRKIMTNEGRQDSYATDSEGRKWAHNAYTNYDYCMSEEKFIDYCSEHKDAIGIILANNEGPYDKNILFRRVAVIERNREKSKENPSQNVDKPEETFAKEVAEKARQRLGLKEKEKAAQDLLNQYQGLTPSDEVSLDDQ